VDYNDKNTIILLFPRVKRLEELMLQQNDIKRIPDAFKVLIKLRNVRLDRNRLTSIDNLLNCSALRSLNLSYNQLTSIEVNR
jgi:Leucine-rich repeat (LRR) protein